ncbi:MAG: MBL fold metallo-hydrolase [Elusimicrobiota bacterium]
MKLTVIYDNRPYNHDWETGWGFSCVVEHAKKKVLFDTGDNPYKLVKNFKKSGIDIKKIDAITFSHKHWDHIDGFEGFLNLNKKADIFIPKNFSNKVDRLVQENGNRVINTGKEKTQITSSIYITPVFKKFLKPDEQSLVLKVNGKLLLITGCAHPGILNMTRETNNIFKENVAMVLGGFHLGKSSDKKVKNIINGLRDEGVEKFGPSHCTGSKAIYLFKEMHPEGFVDIGSGRSLELEDII